MCRRHLEQAHHLVSVINSHTGQYVLGHDGKMRSILSGCFSPSVDFACRRPCSSDVIGLADSPKQTHTSAPAIQVPCLVLATIGDNDMMCTVCVRWFSLVMGFACRRLRLLHAAPTRGLDWSDVCGSKTHIRSYLSQ